MTKRFRGGLFALVGASLLASATRADEPDRAMAKYKAKLNAAVERGLTYLAARQLDADAARALGRPHLAGSFDEPALRGNTGIAALAVMSFLANGHVPGHGKHGDAIDRGIDYILTQQRDDGLLIGTEALGRTTPMYSHSIATLLLCEVSGMVDPARQRRIDKTLPKATLALLRAQKVPKPETHAGGWRYTPGAQDSDLSLTGWSIMALRAAKLNGAAIPDEHIALAVSYVSKCRHRSGAFTYTPKDGKPSTSMTGVALLCLELCGEHGRAELTQAGDYILRNPPQLTMPDGSANPHGYYGFYYCGQAMFQLGGKHWEEFAPALFDPLLAAQHADGRWGQDQAKPLNTTYPTTLAILTLTVPARQLPIYQRDE